eukprot:gene21262-biopygen7114
MHCAPGPAGAVRTQKVVIWPPKKPVCRPVGTPSGSDMAPWWHHQKVGNFEILVDFGACWTPGPPPPRHSMVIMVIIMGSGLRRLYMLGGWAGRPGCWQMREDSMWSGGGASGSPLVLPWVSMGTGGVTATNNGSPRAPLALLLKMIQLSMFPSFSGGVTVLPVVLLLSPVALLWARWFYCGPGGFTAKSRWNYCCRFFLSFLPERRLRRRTFPHFPWPARPSEPDVASQPRQTRELHLCGAPRGHRGRRGRRALLGSPWCRFAD